MNQQGTILCAGFFLHDNDDRGERRAARDDLDDLSLLILFPIGRKKSIPGYKSYPVAMQREAHPVNSGMGPAHIGTLPSSSVAVASSQGRPTPDIVLVFFGTTVFSHIEKEWRFLASNRILIFTVAMLMVAILPTLFLPLILCASETKDAQRALSCTVQ